MLAPLITFLEAPTNRANVQDFFASDDEANSNSKFFCSGSGVIYPEFTRQFDLVAHSDVKLLAWKHFFGGFALQFC